MIRKKILGLFIFVLLVSGFTVQGQLYGQFIKEDFAAEPIVNTEARYDEGMILFKIDMDKNYHITDLKHNFLKIELPENEYLKIKKVEFPKGIPYADELVFKGSFEVPVYVEVLKTISGDLSLKFKLSYQVCQENPQELCYPPASKEVEVKLSRAFKVNEAGGESGKLKDETYSQWVERIVKRELENKSFLLFLLVFIAGFLTSLTPCVYPVIPIVMGFIGTRSGKRKFKGFYLSVFFVLGLAIVYSVFGVIAATTGTMMGLSFQNPIVVIIIAAIFILMGLSLAGLFEIPVPTSISSRIQSSQESEIIGSLLVGGVSGIIAAPCVGPVLIALLSWISQTGNILLGFWLTFTFSLGMGVIFLLVGTFSAVLSAMPKGGNWMNYIKYFFALLLLGGGIYFLSTITTEWLDYLLWG
ncbi:MAG TPA: cytochrome c biogenesis protein CcdA, partial [Candidatus Deferrimicrobium sp.]|nr:cytochrome c biogenesis protein CcdA [Candidatus Deferrimicrobium sp.]